MGLFQFSSSLKFQVGAFYVLLAVVGMGCAQLSPTFYATRCPTALSTIKSAISSAVSKEARMGASLLRLHFHDCFVNGCDGSVLLDGASGEKSAPANNNSIRGFEVIDSVKSLLELSCPGVMSCADILAVAARDSVVALGGPTWTVQLGRRDSATASFNAAVANLPSPFSDLSLLISNFSSKGFTVKEMVALSGAHTIGQARCTVFRTRIHNETNINAAFATSRKAICPVNSGGDNNLAPLDSTPTTFDNAYFGDLLNQRGLLHSDQQLFNGGSADTHVRAYSSYPNSFRVDFANAMTKMGNLSPLTGTAGQIRTNCRKPN